MNTGYEFSDIIGTTYRNGPVRFLPDGFSLLCSNGNRLKLVDLRGNVSRTSSVQAKSNITNFSVNLTGTHAFIASKTGHCVYVNLQNDVVLHSFRTPLKIKVSSFSPDSRFIAIGIGGYVKIYSLVALTRKQFNVFTLENKFVHSTEPVNSLDWSADGRLIVAGGENKIVKIFSSRREDFRGIGVFIFGERTPLIDVWFYGDNYDLVSIDKLGRATFWLSSHQPGQLCSSKNNQPSAAVEQPTDGKLAFTRNRSVNLTQSADNSNAQISATSLNKERKLLATAFANGVFSIFELPALAVLQNFRASEQKINSIHFNSTGDWLALGCGHGTGTQLLVWEWQSETYILRQQSHSQAITTTAYSPDGSILATGAEDGKVKLWNCSTSLCLVTFSEHQSGVSDVCFTQSGKAILSASLEGSVRAHDMKRYRNFRTLVAPKQTQLNLLCADSSGDIVMASSREQFEIYIWALETGQLLDVLTGHTDIVTGIATFENTLCSVSLDKTLRLWNILEGNCFETIQQLNECLDVKCSPTGSILAVLCYDSSINLFDSRSSRQTGTIETKLDIDAGRQKRDTVKKTTSEKNKSFTCIAFSPNGQFLLAGGQSNNFCLYSVDSRIRIRTFKMTSNLSLDGATFDINYRKMTEFGNLDLFDLTDSDEEETNPGKKIRLPGTRHTDLSERAVRTALLISKLLFSPTGQAFAVVSTEGVYLFTLSKNCHFCPFRLDMDVTPDQILSLSRTSSHALAISSALRLNDDLLIRKVVQNIPFEQLRVIVTGLGFELAERLLEWIVASQAGPTPEKNFHFYLIIVKELLYTYGADFKNALERNKPTLTAVHQLLINQKNLFMQTCTQNISSLEYIIMVREIHSAALNCANTS